MTRKEALIWTQHALKGVPDGDIDASLLLAHVLGVSRPEVRLNPQEKLTETQAQALQHMACRRAAREPLQYITGIAGFYGRDFIARPGVLIPRLDTEILAEKALALLVGIEGPRVADIATGSGILGITIKLERADAEVMATDISEDALNLARENAALLGVEMRFMQGDLFCPLDGQFDLIVCNPPYIQTEVLNDLAIEVRGHEPVLALDGGADGLDCYRRLAAQAPAYIKKGGHIALEIGYDQAESVSALFSDWAQGHIYNDLAGLPRVFIAKCV